jgi:hypothetical protein
MNEKYAIMPDHAVYYKAFFIRTSQKDITLSIQLFDQWETL